MKELAISKFKATCLGVLEEVRRTGAPVRVMRFGKPIADIVAPRAVANASWLGCMEGAMELDDDIVGPTGAFDEWAKDGRKKHK